MSIPISIEHWKLKILYTWKFNLLPKLLIFEMWFSVIETNIRTIIISANDAINNSVWSFINGLWKMMKGNEAYDKNMYTRHVFSYVSPIKWFNKCMINYCHDVVSIIYFS